MARTRDVDATSERIMSAATVEFAEHGIAGARVERIAKAARTSKERVYAHFASKEALYHLVIARELSAMAEDLVLDPADLPAYAGRMYDHVVEHPARHRLVQWGRLELGEGRASRDDPMQQSLRGKVEQLRRAQWAGQLDPAWDPQDVLDFVTGLATSGIDRPDPPREGPDRLAFLSARRAAVVAAVRHLFPPVSERPAH